MSTANTPANCSKRSTIQPRRYSKLRPEWASFPHRYALRTQRETTWYQGVSLRLAKLERGCGISLPPSRFESMRTPSAKAYDSAATTVNKPGNKLGVDLFAGVLQALGLLDGLCQIADIGNDPVGQALASAELPKRVHLKRTSGPSRDA